MPEAVTHILVPLVLMALIRDFYLRKKDKKNFPLHYVLIAGLAGLLPDIDILAFWILSSFGFAFDSVHRVFTHTLVFPAIFLVFFFILHNIKVKELGRHKIKISLICLMIAFGSFVHLILDWALWGQIFPVYPFYSFSSGLNLVAHLPSNLQWLFFPSLDAVLLVFWLIYLEVKHRISDFI